MLTNKTLKIEFETFLRGRALLNARLSVSENILRMLCKTDPPMDKSFKSWIYFRSKVWQQRYIPVKVEYRRGANTSSIWSPICFHLMVELHVRVMCSYLVFSVGHLLGCFPEFNRSQESRLILSLAMHKKNKLISTDTEHFWIKYNTSILVMPLSALGFSSMALRMAGSWVSPPFWSR